MWNRARPIGLSVLAAAAVVLTTIVARGPGLHASASTAQLVQDAGATESTPATSLTVHLSAPTAAGDLLVLSASLHTTTTTSPLTAVTDDASPASDTWQRAGAWSTANPSDGEIWYASGVAAGVQNITATTGSSSVLMSLDVQEFSGVVAASPLDEASGSTSAVHGAAAKGRSPYSGGAMAAATTDLAVGLIAGHDNTQTITVTPGTAGFQAENQYGSVAGSTSTSIRSGWASLVNSGRVGFAGTLGAGMRWAAAVALFQTSPGPPPSPTPVPTPPPGSPCVGTASSTPPATYKHVIWIWFENKNLNQVIGNSGAPYMTGLAHECAYSTTWMDNVLHTPSEPNYLAATSGANCDSGQLHATTPSGDTCNVTDANPAATCTDTTCAGTITPVSIFEQLDTTPAGTTPSWREYAETMPVNCDTSDSGQYAAHHNPALFFSHLRIAGQFANNSCASNDIGFPTTTCTGSSCTVSTTANPLLAALSDSTDSTLPTFSFVTPNNCNDMHTSCSGYSSQATNGDQWLAAWMPLITASPGYQAGNTAVFIMFDTGSSHGAAMPNIVVAPTVKPGTVVTTVVNNLAALLATQKMLALTPPIDCVTANGPSCPAGSTADLRGLFNI